MSIQIEVKLELLKKALIAALPEAEFECDDYEAFGSWLFDHYCAVNGNLPEDISNQMEHAGYNLGTAIYQTFENTDNREQTRLKWFKHVHRNNLLTLEQAVHVVQLGYEIWVCNYNSEDEIDMFTHVTISDFDEDRDESLTEWLRDMKAWARSDEHRCR
jgi:hypothetical protein